MRNEPRVATEDNAPPDDTGQHGAPGANEPPPTDGRLAFSRRQFLAGSAALSLGAVMAGRRDQIGRLLADLGGTPAAAALPETLVAPKPSFTFSVERDTDLALLDVAFYNFSKTYDISFNGIRRTEVLTPKLVPTGSDNVITVQLPPQSIAEAAYNFVEGETWYVDPPPVLSAVSGPTLLCFTLATDDAVVFSTMTAADLLDWSNWTLLVPAPAQVNGAGPTPNGPAKTLPTPIPAPANPLSSHMVTYIEYPYGLYLAPTVFNSGSASERFLTTFTGRTTPLVSPDNVADCWTAVLAQTNASDGSARVATAAAVWADDYGASYSAPPIAPAKTGAPDATPETFIDYEASS
jgi:hypothetical protein